MTYQWYCGDEKIAVPLPKNSRFVSELRRRLSNSNEFDCVQLALTLQRDLKVKR